MDFCNDVDLLYWEPDLLREAAFASQLLASGTGDLDGSVFNLTDGAAFSPAVIKPGNVLALGGSAVGCAAITYVLSSTSLLISSLYADLFPESGSAPSSAYPVSATGLPFAVRTFFPQRAVIANLLGAAAGLEPGSPDADAVITNPQALKRVAALGTLQLIYSAVAAAAPEPARYTTRAELYQRLFRRELRQTRIELDLNQDGRPDTTRLLGTVRWTRE